MEFTILKKRYVGGTAICCVIWVILGLGYHTEGTDIDVIMNIADACLGHYYYIGYSMSFRKILIQSLWGALK